MTTARFLRPMRAVLAASIITAGGVVLLPSAGAHASTESFSVSVTGGYNNSSALGTASGTITAVNGGTTAQYSVTLCGQSTYPTSTVTLAAGGATASHSVSYSGCQTFSGTLTSGSPFSSATVKVSGSTFYPGNTYTTYSRTTNVYFSGGVVITPTYSPVTGSVSLTVKGGYNAATPLGTVTGSITSTRGTYTATYSLTLCGNQTYPTSTVTVTAGGASASHTVNYQNCQAFSGTLTSGSPISTAVIKVSGSTFYPGNTYTTYTSQQTVYF